ncbi:hypothetical protein [uncultured Mitsuokella sp.]|uniref:hypothetical protein n=1 Tax=uncultured Mitsuokella sp. TaxID=453120 RepID=UPI0026708C65|nr:hypothetical protein [uncultured Mitsuokella sp.]
MADPNKAAKSSDSAKSSLWKKKRKEIILGSAVALGLVFLGAWGLRALMPGHQQVQTTEAASIGLVDMQKALEAHPDYNKLLSLQKEYKSLELSLKDTEKLPEMPVQPPQVDSKPFDDSVWQKNAQTVIGGRTELEREAKSVEKAYREAHQAEYDSRRKAVDEDYQNAIFNLNLKIDNQKAMHHPWAKQEDLDAEKADWENQRSLLQQERGMRQQELAKEWEKEVNSYVQSVMGPKVAKWQEQAKTAMNQQKSAAVRKQSDVQQRDTQAMAVQNQQDAELNIQKRVQIKKQMAEKAEEIQALDTHIRNDIAGKAAKIAILHHFTLILANPAEDLVYKLPLDVPDSMKPNRFMPVVGSDTEDVTDELVEEMGTLSASDEDSAAASDGSAQNS